MNHHGVGSDFAQLVCCFVLFFLKVEFNLIQISLIKARYFR